MTAKGLAGSNSTLFGQRLGLFVALLVGISTMPVNRAAHAASTGTPTTVSEGSFAQRHGRDRLAIYKMLSSGTVHDPVVFDAYYNDFIREFAHRGNIGRLPDMRRQLAIDFALSGRAENTDSHTRLAGLTLTKMNDLAVDPARHVATRLSAVLVIGDLNDRERNAAAQRPQVPMAKALPVLLSLSRPPVGPTNGADDSVRIGALVGLSRHAELVIGDEPMRQTVLRQMLAFLEQRQTPAGRSAAGHEWLLRRTVDVLGYSIKPQRTSLDAKVFRLLVATIAERTAPSRLRLTAVKAIKNIIVRNAIGAEQLADIMSSSKQLAANLALAAIAATSNKEVEPGNAAIERYRLYQDLMVVNDLAGEIVERANSEGKVKAAELPSLREFSTDLNEAMAVLEDGDLAGSAWNEPISTIARRWDAQSKSFASASEPNK